jgi:MarR family
MCFLSRGSSQEDIVGDMSLPDGASGSWTLLTGHGHVLVEIARDPKARIRDIAANAGITERTAQAIVADLEAAGYITRTRTGRRTRYSVNPDSSFRHPAQEGLRIGPFLAVLATARDDTTTSVQNDGRASPTGRVDPVD